MQLLSKNKFITILVNLMILTLVAKFLTFVILFFLPTEGEDIQTNPKIIMPYHRIKCTNIIGKSTQKHKKTQKEYGLSIDNLILNGLYGNKNYGFAIVAQKSTPNKTKIISIGEKYNGYTLKNIYLNYVIFSKNGTNYTLRLNKKIDIPTSSSHSPYQSQEGDISVSTSDIQYYSKHPSKIWKDISIKDLKQNGKITGFMVTKIKQGSKFSELGLKVGDIILKANGLELKSYKDAIKIYQNIDKLDTIVLLVKRGKQEKEIIYEIN
jgi:type II secretion system protein C